MAFIVILVEPIHYTLARDWIARFEVPLRTLDALHLAITFSSHIPLVKADAGLAASATALGATSLDLSQKLIRDRIYWNAIADNLWVALSAWVL